jgi:hypothetical protein
MLDPDANIVLRAEVATYPSGACFQQLSGLSKRAHPRRRRDRVNRLVLRGLMVTVK